MNTQIKIEWINEKELFNNEKLNALGKQWDDYTPELIKEFSQDDIDFLNRQGTLQIYLNKIEGVELHEPPKDKRKKQFEPYISFNYETEVRIDRQFFTSEEFYDFIREKLSEGYFIQRICDDSNGYSISTVYKPQYKLMEGDTN